MSDQGRIDKTDIVQKVIRETIPVRLTGPFLALRHIGDKVALYSWNEGVPSTYQVRAFLTEDTVDPARWAYIDTFHVWGMTLHFFRQKDPQ